MLFGRHLNRKFFSTRLFINVATLSICFHRRSIREATLSISVHRLSVSVARLSINVATLS